MKITLSLSMITAATPVFAHPGHLIEVAGHGHLLGAAAAGAAILIGIWAAGKGRKKEEAEPESDETPQEA